MHCQLQTSQEVAGTLVGDDFCWHPIISLLIVGKPQITFYCVHFVISRHFYLCCFLGVRLPLPSFEWFLGLVLTSCREFGLNFGIVVRHASLSVHQGSCIANEWNQLHHIARCLVFCVLCTCIICQCMSVWAVICDMSLALFCVVVALEPSCFSSRLRFCYFKNPTLVCIAVCGGRRFATILCRACPSGELNPVHVWERASGGQRRVNQQTTRQSPREGGDRKKKPKVGQKIGVKNSAANSAANFLLLILGISGIQRKLRVDK